MQAPAYMNGQWRQQHTATRSELYVWALGSVKAGGWYDGDRIWAEERTTPLARRPVLPSPPQRTNYIGHSICVSGQEKVRTFGANIDATGFRVSR